MSTYRKVYANKLTAKTTGKYIEWFINIFKYVWNIFFTQKFSLLPTSSQNNYNSISSLIRRALDRINFKNRGKEMSTQSKVYENKLTAKTV